MGKSALNSNVVVLIVVVAIAVIYVATSYGIKVHDNPISTIEAFKPNQLSEKARSYEAAVADARAGSPPVLQFLALDEHDRALVQKALTNSDFTAWVRDPLTGQALRNEIMAVRPVKVGDLPEEVAQRCTTSKCRVVELFNFSLNVLTVGVYSEAGELLSLRHLHDIQPEVPEHLTQIAYEIAAQYPPLIEAMGTIDPSSSFIMGGTKSALSGTTCDRSRTLCVSATLVRNGFAYWVIVNLEDFSVVGMQQTGWKDGNPHPISESIVRDTAIMDQLCRTPQNYTHEQWSFSYALTSSDGARVGHLRFRGEEFISEATNVDWHVSYSGTSGFGYSDAVGCPLFSAAAVVPADLPKWKTVSLPDQTCGVELHQDFLSPLWPMPCNYYYENRLQLFPDGRFRVAVASVGRGCGDNGTYRPVQRFAFPGNQKVYKWGTGGWELISQEVSLSVPKDSPRSPEGAVLKIELASGRALLVTLGEGQFADGGRGDNPFLYLTRTQEAEGGQDLATIGPCCNEDAQQGPEKFINGEGIVDDRVTLWYVAQLKNDGRQGQEYCWGRSELIEGKFVRKEYPCIAGPLFTPQ